MLCVPGGLQSINSENVPTPKVNTVGKIKVNNVILRPSPDQSDQVNSAIVERLKTPIAQNRFWSARNWIPTNPNDNNMEVITNRRRLLIKVINLSYKRKVVKKYY